MRIDGTDAPNIGYSTAADTATPTKENKVETKDTKKVDTSLDTLNLSQINSLEKKEMPVSEKVVIDAIERANKAISGANTRFEFSIHKKTKEIMVKVIDTDTGDVIREIPPEKTLDMVARMWEMAGIVVDERR